MIYKIYITSNLGYCINSHFNLRDINTNSVMEYSLEIALSLTAKNIIHYDVNFIYFDANVG